jgi:hypothetical protein
MPAPILNIADANYLGLADLSRRPLLRAQERLRLQRPARPLMPSTTILLPAAISRMSPATST